MTARAQRQQRVVIPGLGLDPRVAYGHRRALPAGDAGPFVSFVVKALMEAFEEALR
jgi:hypothetical protein